MLVADVGVVAECPTPTVEQAFDTSRAVFVGRASSQRVVTGKSAADWKTETTFDVEQSWKGSAEKRHIQIQTCGGTVGDSSVTCGESFSFTIGERYLVFAAGQPLTTNTCEPTRRVSDAHDVLTWLSARTSKRLSGKGE
jgi:hypothetical protein